MAMEIVNGYPCRDCTDAEKAKKGIDPTPAQCPPVKPRPMSNRARAPVRLTAKDKTGAASIGRFPLEMSGRH